MAPAPAAQKSRFPLKAMFAGAIVVAALVAAAVLLLGGDDKSSGGGKAASSGDLPEFALNYPKGWKRVDVRAGEHLAIAKSDGTGRVALRIRGPVKQSLKDMSVELRGSLKKSVKGFKLISSETVDIAAGRALYTDWYGSDSKLVFQNLVVPAGKNSFTLDAAVAAGHDKTAEDVGDIFSAFQADQK
jgi:hypothetical protein